MSGILHNIDEPVRWDNPVPLVLVRGWCFARSGPGVVEIHAKTSEGIWRGIHGLSRPDVGNAFDDAAGADGSGFVVRVPRPSDGHLVIEFEAELTDGSRHHLETVNLAAS